MNFEVAKVQALKDIAKELHEINRKLDRMCNSDVFTKSKKEAPGDALSVMKEIVG